MTIPTEVAKDCPFSTVCIVRVMVPANLGPPDVTLVLIELDLGE